MLERVAAALTVSCIVLAMAPAGSQPIPPIPQPPNIPPIPAPPLPPVPQPPGVLEAPWLPANTGIMWWEGNNDLSPPNAPAGEPGGALWLTRRIATHPFVPGLMHLGSLVHGAYASLGGSGWASTTPGCLLPNGSPIPDPANTYGPTRSFAVALSGLDVCSIESVAFDPLFPYRVYATGFSFQFPGSISDGGIYVSDDFGMHWRKVRGGLRGNGLAVARSFDESQARIVAGSIQQNNGTVGSTPGNGSLMISDDDGETWRAVTLPASGCPDQVTTSQRITPTVRMPPLDSARIYVGTNAGLYTSADGGSTWRYALPACGGVWGIGLSADGSRVVVGDHSGQVWLTDRDAASFQPIGNVGGNRVQDVVIDPLNPNVAYACTWEGGGAAVYRIRVGGGVTRLKDPNLGQVDRAWPAVLPQPFPFSPQANAGNAPSLFLAKTPGALWVSTLLRGVFVRAA